MYIFDTTKKQEVLKGRTSRFIAKDLLHCSEVHLRNVLNGKSGCSYRLAKDLVQCISDDARVEDYFKEK